MKWDRGLFPQACRKFSRVLAMVATKVKKNDNCTEFRKQAVENAFMVV